jgi:hypothetical protein
LNLNIDSLIFLLELFKYDYFDERVFSKLIKTKGMRGFFEHERARGKDINIREELEKVIYDGNYKDSYGLYKAKKDLKSLEEDINNIQIYEKYIIEKAMENIYKIIPKGMKVKCKIYLFSGGEDGGFTISRNKIYINYANYINNMEELIKIISHELYHSRNISYKNRICFSIKTAFSEYNKVYEIIGKIIEEGLASLVQHGPTLKVDDPAGTLNDRSLLLIWDEFELLNEIILDIKGKRKYNKKLENLNIYAIGYYIVSTIYNTDGVLILDNWTVGLKYKEILERYIEICNEKGMTSGFNKDIKGLVINC